MNISLIFPIRGDTWRSILCTLCILCCCSVAFGQRRVSGKVVDAGGLSVVGAGVSEKGTTNGAMSDSDGRFSISVRGRHAVLRVSYMGYVTQEVAVGDRSEISVTLVEDTQALDEVVVVGYGTQKKANLSGAVSTISPKTLDNRPVSNANLALQGLAPGMNIHMSDSYATSAPGINIRGFTSINGGEALILVDNVPVTAQELSRMNPADIESATVLKDAASAAIYGARAGFGVVLITTKTAKSEKLTVDLNASYGLRSFIDFPELVTDSYDYMQMLILSANQPGRYTQEQLDYALARRADPSLPAVLRPEEAKNPTNRTAGNWEMYANSDWAEIFMTKYSPVQTYNMRVGQKGEKLSYTMSGEYYRQEGLMQNTVNDVLDRYNFRSVGTYKMNGWWELGSNISFTSRTFTRSPLLDDTWSYYRVVQGYVTIPLHTPDGYAENDWLGELTSDNTKTSVLRESQYSFNTTVSLIKNVWTVKGDANFRFKNEVTNTETFAYVRSQGPEKLSTVGSTGAGIDNDNEKYVVYNLYTDFHKTFAGKHFVQALAGFNQEYWEGESSGVGADWLVTPSLPTIELTTPLSNIDKSHDVNALALRGVFGRLSYIFDDRYILELNGRYDGSSRFRKDGRFGFFPSGSLAWNLSRESFMKSINDRLRISHLKLRSSYGVLGNQVVEDADGNPVYYPAIATMGYNSKIDQMLNGVQPSAVMQPGVVSGDLTWETVRSINGGVDLNLFDNRLELNFDKYVRYTENMLARSKTLSAVFGATEPRANAANLKTLGWEVSAGWRDEFELLGSPLSYSLRLTLSDSRAYITRYDNPDKLLTNSASDQEYYEGMEIGEIWGYETLGYFASDDEAAGWYDQTALGNGLLFLAGDLKFNNLNGDDRINQGSNTVDDPGDRRIIGNSSYRFPYSGDLNIEWKGFDLRIFIEGIGKREAYPGKSHNGLWFWGQFTTPYGAMTLKNLDNWTYRGDAGYFPRVKSEIAQSGELAKEQTKYLQDASYLRVKNVALGYTLPKTLTDKAGIGRLRLYVTAENLLTFHHIEVQGIDPERFDTVYYPFMKVVSMGANISF